MRNIALMTGLVALTAVLLGACGSQPRNANQSDIRSVCETCGNIERIERVRLRAQESGIGAGAVLGAIIGGAAGSNVGSGDNRTVAIAAGAAAGGVIGHQIQKNNRKKAYQFDVRLDDGRWAQVTQLEKLGMRVGDRVVIREDQVQYLR